VLELLLLELFELIARHPQEELVPRRQRSPDPAIGIVDDAIRMLRRRREVEDLPIRVPHLEPALVARQDELLHPVPVHVRHDDT